ncbi:MAG: sulfatase family protein, partial [Gammaproteobacteria bacterium]
GPQGPDVLVIVVDTLRADRVGAYGAARDTTPELDAFAREGILFEETCAQAPRTWQSFVSILTGLYPPHHGVRFIHDEPLAADIPHLGSILGDAGYDTASFDPIPFVRGMTGGRGFGLYLDAEVAGRWVQDIELAGAVEKWLGQERDHPAFAFVRLHGPHWPYKSDPGILASFGEEEYAQESHRFVKGDYGIDLVEAGHGFTLTDAEAYRERIFDTNYTEREFEHMSLHYDASVRTTDAVVGHMLDWLRESGRLESTLVVVTSDHGESLGERGYLQHGPRVDYTVMRVPLIVRFPADAAHGRRGLRVGQLVRSVDIAPTVVETLGLEPPARLDGVSLLSVVDDGTELGRTCYGETDREFMGVDPELALPGIAGKQRMLRSQRFKVIYRHDGKSPIFRLYDLAEDPHEERDVGTEHPEELAKLKAELGSLMAGDNSPDEGETPLTPEQIEQFRALGYVQ